MYLLKLVWQIVNIYYHPNSHSTMYLLKPIFHWFHECIIVKFTFHHVSIKTKYPPNSIRERYTFTFHHVSIKTCQLRSMYDNLLHSHSTMYLLKLLINFYCYPFRLHSHSTMYLLKPIPVVLLRSHLKDSHSTMYLLKRCRIIVCPHRLCKFTFHHVSIKTVAR